MRKIHLWESCIAKFSKKILKNKSLDCEKTGEWSSVRPASNAVSRIMPTLAACGDSRKPITNFMSGLYTWFDTTFGLSSYLICAPRMQCLTMIYNPCIKHRRASSLMHLRPWYGAMSSKRMTKITSERKLLSRKLPKCSHRTAYPRTFPQSTMCKYHLRHLFQNPVQTPSKQSGPPQKG